MIDIYLFGATTLSGEAFAQLEELKNSDFRLITYSRKSKHHYNFDLLNPNSFKLKSLENQFILINYSPIWLFAPFLQSLFNSNKNNLDKLKAVITCSSSSIETKKYSTNEHDKKLFKNLNKSEKIINNICCSLNVNCLVVRPTLIYGIVGKYSDNNLCKIVSFMEKLPVLFLPKVNGLRQPIHAFQLARIIFKYVKEFSFANKSKSLIKTITIGGDTTLSYLDMIKNIQKQLPVKHPAKKCKLITIPNKLFTTLSFPIFWLSPKLFDSILRINANLAGFIPAHKILETKPLEFPINNKSFIN